MSQNSVLLVFCAMVCSGEASTDPEAVADGILDSTAFSVAMFVMGWVATRRMKSSESPFGLQWFLPPPLLRPNVYSRPKSGDAPIEAKQSPSSGDETELQEPLPEPSSQRPCEVPLAAPSQEALPEVPMQPPEEEDSAALLAGLSSILASRLVSAEKLEIPPWRRNCFHSSGFSDWTLSDYMTHIHWFFECSSPCLVLALIYLDRALARSTKLTFNSDTCHRLFLTSLLMASKFHDDESTPYSNDFYATVGHVAVENINDMEKQFCKLIDWRFYVKPEEFLLNLDIITSAGYPRE